MISDTIFVIQNSPFVKWMTHNTLFYGSYGDGWIIATYGHCTSWMLYKYTIEQFYSFREKMHCIKLYCIYFKSMCLVTIPLVDYATLFCLEVTVAEETKELFIISILFKIIFHNSFNTWTIGRGLHAVQAVSLDPIYVGSRVGQLLFLLSLVRKENRNE